MTPVAERLAARFWPGALTLVLPQRPDAPLPELLTGGRPTIGVRLPDHAVPRALARRLGPLAVSSAKSRGEPDATTAAQVLASLGRAGRAGDRRWAGQGRRAVDRCCLPGRRRGPILRAGAITEADVRAAARK